MSDEDEQLREELLSAYIAGFRHSSEGYNGELTPPDVPEPWSGEIRDHDRLRQEFSEWLEGRKKPRAVNPELRALVSRLREEAEDVEDKHPGELNRNRTYENGVCAGIRYAADELEELLDD